MARRGFKRKMPVKKDVKLVPGTDLGARPMKSDKFPVVKKKVEVKS